MDLRNFLVLAKKDTYASGRPAEKLSDGWEGYRFVSSIGTEEWVYEDKFYVKSNNIIGRELVSLNGTLEWGMNYCGNIIKAALAPDIPEESIWTCLKNALSNVTIERPYRGPNVFREGDIEYKCGEIGSIDGFTGMERMRAKGIKEVYNLAFNGGKL
ncbi:XRE family transcriptional regulator [Candidatus Pacearchaeota archaeon]|nr:XRE family transcriptional regulator [Candidatus Pacearchaeota archaeon]